MAQRLARTEEKQVVLTKFDSRIVEMTGPSLEAIRHNVARVIRHGRWTKAYAKDKAKLEISIICGSSAHRLFGAPTLEYLVQEEKADVKAGIAPAGDLERRIQEVLDSVDK